MKAKSIEIVFPFEMEIPKTFTDALISIIETLCKEYKKAHPGRVMWFFGCGCKPIWREPEEPTYDDSIYQIEIAERQSYEGMTEKQKKEALIKSLIESVNSRSVKVK